MRCKSKIQLINQYRPVKEVSHNIKVDRNKTVTQIEKRIPYYCDIGDNLDIISDDFILENTGFTSFNGDRIISVINKLGEIFRINLNDVENIEAGFFYHIPYKQSFGSTIQLDYIEYKRMDNDVFSDRDYRFKKEEVEEEDDDWFKK